MHLLEGLNVIESSVALQFVLDIQRFSLDDDSESLNNMGLDTGVAASIAKMDAKAMRILCKGSFFNIQIDQSKLDNLLAYVDREKQQSDFIDQLILKDAPRKMMVQCFGLTGSEYVGMRKIQGLEKAPIGRWKIPKVDIELKTHQQFLAEIDTHQINGDDLMQLPRTCMSLSDRYQFTIREVLTVWNRFDATMQWHTASSMI